MPPARRGPNGERLCRWCGAPVPKGRLYWCSDECVEDYRLRSDPAYLRRKVFERDRGVCARCGKDTSSLAREIQRLWRQAWGGPQADEARARLKELGFEWCRGPAPHLWEAHHVIPVADGGGECDLSNIETLCRPCHRAVTAEWRRRKAEERRHARAKLDPQVSLFDGRQEFT